MRRTDALAAELNKHTPFLLIWRSQHIVTRAKNDQQTGVSRENNATATCARE